MNVVTERRKRINRVDDVLREIPRMGGGKADAADARQLPDGSQQFGESLFAGGITVRIHVLPEQLNVGVAGVGHAGGFAKHRLRGAAALFATSVRHHAIGAELIAAFNDGDVSPMRVGAGGELGLESLVGLAIVKPGDATSPSFDLNQ